jgi:hypothetical protein
LEWFGLRGGGSGRGRFSRLLFEELRQICMRDAHSLRDLHQSAIVQGKLVSLLQLVAVFVVRISQEVARLVIHHDPAIEGVELEKSILPPLLLSSDILREETSEFGHRRGILRGGDGGDVRSMLRVSERSRHRVDTRLVRVAFEVGDMEAGLRRRAMDEL